METILESTDNITIMVLLFCVSAMGVYILFMHKTLNKLIDNYIKISKEATASNIELATLLKGFLSR